MTEGVKKAADAMANGGGGGATVTSIHPVTTRFYPNALGKGFIALGFAFLAAGYAGKKFGDAARDAIVEANKS